VLELASSDPRVVSAAVVGSLAHGEGDRWSDVDLTFGLTEDVSVADVLDDFTQVVSGEFDAVHLIDLDARGTTYRVFLLPGWLQVDLSFTPSRDVPQAGSGFRLLFGTSRESPASPPAPQELFGWAVLYARHAHVCIERRHWWQAEHYVSAVRDYALTLACRIRGLPTAYAKGFEALPADVLDGFHGALVRSLDRDELLRALACAVDGLLREAAQADVLGEQLEGQLRALASLPS
jgi:hypothetical protein